MSELKADLDRAAAAYWMRVARAGGADASAALSNAQRLIVEARAERRAPDAGQSSTLDQIGALKYRP